MQSENRRYLPQGITYGRFYNGNTVTEGYLRMFESNFNRKSTITGPSFSAGILRDRLPASAPISLQ